VDSRRESSTGTWIPETYRLATINRLRAGICLLLSHTFAVPSRDAQMPRGLECAHVRFCQEQVEHWTLRQARRDCEAEDYEAHDAHSGRDPIEVTYTEAQLAVDLLRRVRVHSDASPTSRKKVQAHGERGLAAVFMMLQPCGNQSVLSADSAPPSPETSRSGLESLKRMPFSRLKSLMPSITPYVRATHMCKEPKVTSSKSSLVSRVNGWKRDAARRLRSPFTVSHGEARDSSQGSDAERYEQILENFRRAASTCREVTASKHDQSKWHQTGPFKLSSESKCSTASTVFGRSDAD